MTNFTSRATIFLTRYSLSCTCESHTCFRRSTVFFSVSSCSYFSHMSMSKPMSQLHMLFFFKFYLFSFSAIQWDLTARISTFTPLFHSLHTTLKALNLQHSSHSCFSVFLNTKSNCSHRANLYLP